MSSAPIIDPRLQKALLVRAAAEHRRRKDSLEQAAAMRASFRKFVPAAWPQMEPAKAFIPSWNIDAICDHLQAGADGHIKTLLMTVPPGSAKSLLSCVAFPAWQWARHQNSGLAGMVTGPQWRGTFLSYDEKLSTRDSVKCRDLLQSSWYRETFEPQWGFASDQNEKTYYVNTAKGFRVSGRGTGWRSHALIFDDPLNAKERLSDASLAECVDLWDNVLFNRFIDMALALKIIIMQRLGDRDLAGHVLRKGNVEHLKIALEYDPARSKVTTLENGKEWRDPRKRAGEIMCPELFPPAVVEELKSNPERWASQYQQEPNVDGGGIFKAHKWNYWKPPTLNLPPVRVKMPGGNIEERVAVDLPSSFDLMLQSWDMAVKDLKTSDFVCGQVHAVRGAQRFILKQVMRKMGIVDTMAAIREMTGDFPMAHMKLIEDKANGAPVVEMLEKEIAGMIRVNPQDGKVARAGAASPEVESGNWYLPHPAIAPWVGNPENPTDGVGFLSSTSLFPYGAHDDDVDAFSQGAIRIQKEKIGGVFGVSEQDIRVEPFDLKTMATWPRLYGMHVDYRDIAAIWITRQPQTNQHYLYAEYFAPSSDPAQQAAAIMKTAAGCRGFIVPDAGTRELKDGYALVRKYTQLGLKLESIQEHLDTSIVDVSDAFRSGKLKVFGPLAAFFGKYRSFRRNEKSGKLQTEGVGVILAAMVAWRARDKMREPVEPSTADANKLLGGGSSWMSG